MRIRVYNTLTGRKEPFETVYPGKVGIYLCGPTVYKPSHIGHAFGPVIFDAVKRYLVFRGYEVTLVVNITDVDDKLIVEAREQGVTVPELARRIERNYRDALAVLGVTTIDHFPRASEHMNDIIAFIQRLIDRGAAYVSDADVYFDITADDDYGKLSHRRTEDQVGQRELVSGPKRHPGDFALWKAAKPEEPNEVRFDSPWGPGRPGWHIECSAMSMRLLGETLDIHAGGMDLMFPHHENEIAQSESCTGKPFARYWMHNGLTRFNTKKVSKSDPTMQAALREMTLSNLFRQYSGELLRFFILSTHYRRPIEYSTEELASKRKALAGFYRLFDRIAQVSGRDVYKAVTAPPLTAEGGNVVTAPDPAELEPAILALQKDVQNAQDRFKAAMDDDFNTAAAIAVLFDLATAINRFIEERKLETAPAQADTDAAADAGERLVQLANLLGLFQARPVQRETGGEIVHGVLQAHVEVRQLCRAVQCRELAQLIRDGLDRLGIRLEDKATDTTWQREAASGWPSGDVLLDALVRLHIDVRQACRKTKRFEVADAIRDKLAAAGIALEDKPTGTVWRKTN
jgi:cysteinyl-tRNA synthetase